MKSQRKQAEAPEARRHEAPQAQRHFDTVLIHGAESRREEGGATLPPLYYSTAFEHESAEMMEEVFSGKQPGNIYSRLQNPTVEALERRITEACLARGTLATASGMSAITLSLLGLLKSGDEIVVGRYLFGLTYPLLARTFGDLGITAHFFDPRHPAEAERLITPTTRALFLEAIANPAMVVPDLAAYGELCNGRGIPLVVDATLLTPYLFDAERLATDVALFSSSKYLAGPASIVGGLIVDTGRFAWHRADRFDFSDFRSAGPDAYLALLRKRLMAETGACLSPMNAFLQLLGLETLSLRMERHFSNAGKVAGFLRDHPRVEGVSFPGLPGDEFHELAKAQFNGNYGSVMALHLKDKDACFRFLNRLGLIKRATNLGDTKTIAIHPASTIYGTFWPDQQALMGVTDRMVRLSVGLEDPDDLLADLDQALRP